MPFESFSGALFAFAGVATGFAATAVAVFLLDFLLAAFFRAGRLVVFAGLLSTDLVSAGLVSTGLVSTGLATTGDA